MARTIAFAPNLYTSLDPIWPDIESNPCANPKPAQAHPALAAKMGSDSKGAELESWNPGPEEKQRLAREKGWCDQASLGPNQKLAQVNLLAKQRLQAGTESFC